LRARPLPRHDAQLNVVGGERGVVRSIAGILAMLLERALTFAALLASAATLHAAAAEGQGHDHEEQTESVMSGARCIVEWRLRSLESRGNPRLALVGELSAVLLEAEARALLVLAQTIDVVTAG
jgi:hypothetical protein